MKKAILICLATLVFGTISFILIRALTHHFKSNETITPVDSAQIYKEKKDSVMFQVDRLDSLFRADITESERTRYRDALRARIIRQLDSLPEVKANSQPTSNGL